MRRNKLTPVADSVAYNFKFFLKIDSLKRFKTFQKSISLVKDNRIDDAMWTWKEVIDLLNKNVEEKRFANFLWNHWFPSLKPLWKIEGEKS